MKPTLKIRFLRSGKRWQIIMERGRRVLFRSCYFKSLRGAQQAADRLLVDLREWKVQWIHPVKA